jgi:hypothetical protein
MQAMRIDHLVWYNADLAEGQRHFAGRMNAAPSYGGEHPGEGTANAVMALGPGTYLEILGRDPGQSEEGLDPEVKGLAGSGLYHWAVGGVDVSALAARAAAAGLESGGLVPGGRIKPDGTRLEWLCWGLRNHSFGSLIPFFIDWRGSEHPAASAPLGGHIASFQILTPEAGKLRGIFDVLGLDFAVIEDRESCVAATLESARGRTELRSFAPLPRGYVI